MQILDGKNHAGGRYQRFIRDMILYLLNGEETPMGHPELADDSRSESTKRITV